MRFILKNLGDGLDNTDEVKSVLRLQAIETLTHFFNRKTLDEYPRLKFLLQPLIPDIMTYIVQSFTVKSDIKVVNVITNIISCFSEELVDKNHELLTQLLEKTINKILYEIDTPQVGTEYSTPHVNIYECWNMITEIVKNIAIMANFGVFIESKLQKIFDLINTKEEMNYDYDIIKTVTHIIESTKNVSDYVMGTFTNYL